MVSQTLISVIQPYFTHVYSSAWKQRERQSQIDALPPIYSAPLSLSEEKIHSLSISQIVSQCRSGILAPTTVMLAYAKKVLLAQNATNCVSDIMFEEALAIPSVANWGPGVDSDTTINDSTRERSLLGVPVSIKGGRCSVANIKAHIIQFFCRYNRYRRS